MPETSLLGHVNTASSPAVEGSPNVFIGGVPVLRAGDNFADGSLVASGAPHVKINGRAAARIGDPVTGGRRVADGCLKVRIGNSGGFDAFRCGMARGATDKEKLLLCLSSIAKAETGRASTPEDKDGWRYLQSMFQKWFSGMANENARANPDFFPIDWAWTQRFAWAVNAYYMFTFYGNRLEPHNIYNQAARDRLGELLRDDGKLHPEKNVPFDYTDLPPLERIKYSFNYRPVPPNYIPPTNGLLAALAGYTLYALGRGHTEPADRGGHTITLSGATVFVHDGFEFTPRDDFRYWHCKEKRFEPFWHSEGHGWFQVKGADFLSFRAKYRFGNDFQVFSDLHEVEGFRELCYDYP